MMGHLVQLGIFIPRAKMRASIHRIDPINTSLRREALLSEEEHIIQVAFTK